MIIHKVFFCKGAWLPIFTMRLLRNVLESQWEFHQEQENCSIKCPHYQGAIQAAHSAIFLFISSLHDCFFFFSRPPLSAFYFYSPHLRPYHCSVLTYATAFSDLLPVVHCKNPKALSSSISKRLENPVERQLFKTSSSYRVLNLIKLNPQ